MPQTSPDFLLPIVQYILTNGTSVITMAETILAADPQAIAVLEEAKTLLPFFQAIFSAKTANVTAKAEEEKKAAELAAQQ